MTTRERPSTRKADDAPRPPIPVHNPITEALIGEMPTANVSEVRAAVARARAAFPEWAARPVEERARLLVRLAERLWRDQKHIMRVIRDETGKNEAGAYEEVLVIEFTLRHYAHHAPEWLRPENRAGYVPIKLSGKVYYKPYGVVGFITPWNYPLLNAFQDLIPALVAGNTVVLKPSEVTPFTAKTFIDMMHEVGFPQDVVRVVYGDGRTGAALVEEADYIAFTGSTTVGKKIAVRAAERLIPVSLEMGGKDPLIVLKDADIEQAAVGALVGALENAGQVCVGIERVYVEAPVYEHFLDRMLYYVEKMNIGGGDGLDVHMGSLTNDREVERAEAQIADAVAKGARVIYGGQRRPDLGPRFFEPTILVDVDHTMDVMTEETFGPLIPVMRVQDADEAIRLANDSHYGLSAAIYTRDLKKGEQLATHLESGDVHINCTQWIFGMLTLPMGGVKESGIGRRNGKEGLMRFVQPQSLTIDNGMFWTPTLTLLDPFKVQVALLLRQVRIVLPFLRP